MNIETCEALRIDEHGEISWTQLIELSGLAEAELQRASRRWRAGSVAAGGAPWSFHGRARRRGANRRPPAPRV